MLCFDGRSTEPLELQNCSLNHIGQYFRWHANHIAHCFGQKRKISFLNKTGRDRNRSKQRQKEETSQIGSASPAHVLDGLTTNPCLSKTKVPLPPVDHDRRWSFEDLHFRVDFYRSWAQARSCTREKKKKSNFWLGLRVLKVKTVLVLPKGRMPTK